MSEFLFKDFNGASARQWKQKIQYDLKGEDYNNTLVWQSPEGVHVKPFYHADDLPEGFSPIPGQPSSWSIAQKIFIDDVAIAQKIALDALERGAESIVFRADREFDFKALFAAFPNKDTPIYFELDFLSGEFLIGLKDFLAARQETVYFNLDPIGKLARSGNWFHNEKSDFQILGNMVLKLPNNRLFGVDASLYQNAGANINQQLAYALGHANEYLNRFASGEEWKNNPETRDFRMVFKISVGSNYFFEIAKLRALRKLYAAVAKEYGSNEACLILAFPSVRNKTLYDYNVNLLRTTTECMSAILGGADAVCNLAYDALYHKSNEFGERIARNQLLILKNESKFDEVVNPADGAYYVEGLTKELASKALALFKEIEKSGGFLKQLKEGAIQKKIKESGNKEQEAYDKGELKLLGTNYHANAMDRMKGELELYPFVKHNPIKTLIPPIVARRLTEGTEQERLSKE